MSSKGPLRNPVALNFYVDACNKEQIERLLRDFRLPDLKGDIVAGILPHAGWAYSGRVAAKVFKCIKEKNPPDTFVLLGAIHSLPERNSVYAQGTWATPLGEVQVDEELARGLLAALKDKLAEDPQAHSGEHSLEVQLPFIKYFFPSAKIVPIRIAADSGAASLGVKIGECLLKAKKGIAVIGTTDLTHYGDPYGFAPAGYGDKAYSWMKNNDTRIVKLALEMKADDIVKEAAVNYNACGSGALAATVAAATALGAEKGILLEYTTSHEVSGENDFHMGVGYAGILFIK